MINFSVQGFLIGRALLWQEMQGAKLASEKDRRERVPPSMVAGIERHVKMAMKECVHAISLDEANSTCIRIENLLNNYEFQPYTWTELHEVLKRLWDDIDTHLGYEYFYHYSRETAEQLLLVETDWKETLKAFPSAKPEIFAAIDCYALGHYASCVFHMSRIGEIGLRTIGRERGIKKLRRGVPIDWGTWGHVFEKIEPAIEDIRRKPNGPKKSAALQFYDKVLSDLRAVQSLYRDPSMHFHDTYDVGQAQSAIFRVKELMNTLATKLDENSTRAIPWSAWK
jgi:hypothetical protein